MAGLVPAMPTVEHCQDKTGDDAMSFCLLTDNIDPRLATM